MKKYFAITIFITMLSFYTWGQCSNPYAGDDVDVCGCAVSFNVQNATTGSWVAYFDGSPVSVSYLPDNTATSVDVSVADFVEPLLQLDFVWTDDSGPCTDTVVVSFYQKPQPFAGLDDAVCGETYNLNGEISIEESENYTPSVYWGVSSYPPGQMVNIEPYNSPEAEINVSGTGIWEFYIIERNSLLSSCYSTDTVQIEFVEMPVVYAGEDFDVCGTCTQLSGTSGGYSGSWLPNGALYEDYINCETEVSVNQYGPRTFIWLESNQASNFILNCTAIDTVIITFWPKPTANILTDEADSVACGITFDNLRAENPGSSIIGYWWDGNPATTYANEFDYLTSVTVPNYGYYDFYWIEETGPELIPSFCTDTAGPLSIHFLNEHPIHAGNDHDVFGYECELEGTSVSETNPYIDCTYFWSSFGAVIEDIHSLQTSVSVSEYGEYKFVLHSSYENMTGCADRDTVKINFRDPIYQGVSGNKTEDWYVFPNPAHDYISILSDKNINSVQIYDINGKQIKSVSDSYEFIDVSGFEQGLYFVVIYADDEVLTRKFVR